jgi:orotate phosphoribosyltransferase
MAAAVAMDIIVANGAKAKGVIVAVDRQEKGKGDISAIQEIEKNFGIQVLSIISLSHLVDYLKQGSDQALIERIEAYRLWL